MAKQIVVDRLRMYKEYKKELEYKCQVARSLTFDSEVLSIKNDIRWCKEIIDLLNDINSEKQYIKTNKRWKIEQNMT